MASRQTIVLIEDNPDNALVVEDVAEFDMRGGGLWDGLFIVCESGPRFFAYLDAHQELTVDLLLLDLQLPRMDGYAILRRVRELPRLAQAQVVALTAYVLPEEIQKARDAGFNHFIGKPLANARFRRQLLTLLQGGSVWEPF